MCVRRAQERCSSGCGTKETPLPRPGRKTAGGRSLDGGKDSAGEFIRNRAERMDRCIALEGRL